MPQQLSIEGPGGQGKVDDSCGAEERQKSVLDSLIGTILSQNTTDSNSHRAFQALKAKYPTWEEVRVAAPEDVEEPIKMGGLAAIKTGRIQVILNTLKQERGECSMEYLRDLETEQIKKELTRFKGVGAKTVSCVLMFCLNRSLIVTLVNPSP